MKKEARLQAETMFLDADGKISNIAISKKVGVNPLTVGRWKKADDWIAKLTKGLAKAEEKELPRSARKKNEYDKAVKLYLASQGKITNKELAKKVGVSPASVATWKVSEHWVEKLKKPDQPSSPATVGLEAPAQTALSEKAEPEIIEIDLEELACPAHITRLNKRIDDMLSQDYLSPLDLRTVAEAKEAVLGAVSAYIDIIERASED